MFAAAFVRPSDLPLLATSIFSRVAFSSHWNLASILVASLASLSKRLTKTYILLHAKIQANAIRAF